MIWLEYAVAAMEKGKVIWGEGMYEVMDEAVRCEGCDGEGDGEGVVGMGVDVRV